MKDAVRLDLGALAMPLVLDALELQEGALAPDGQHIEAGAPGCGDGRRRPRIVGEDDGRRTLRQQRLEQPHLGSVIVLDRRMVVHVVAAEIGEGAGGEPHAVEPALVEAVARRFHRGVRDTFVGELPQQPMQRHRIGRRQRAIFVAAGRDDAGRADAGRRLAVLLPDLPGERSDRRLAAGAGDGDHRVGLLAEEARCRQRQRQPRIGDFDHRHRGVRPA